MINTCLSSIIHLEWVGLLSTSIFCYPDHPPDNPISIPLSSQQRQEMLLTEMWSYYSTGTQEHNPQMSIASTLVIIAIGLGLVHPLKFNLIQLHHLIIHYPRQAPLMITLSFILINNVFFLALLVRHTLMVHPTILNWSFITSFLRVNFFYVPPSQCTDQIRSYQYAPSNASTTSFDIAIFQDHGFGECQI
jgi:hypothetical protein